MLHGLKRWFSGKSVPSGSDWQDVAQWAAQRHGAFRSVPGEGFVIDGRVAGSDWRLEWGPPQRAYMQGAELRLRAELPVNSALQLVVMNRALQESLEKSMFELAVEGVQTRIDDETPAEARWLVMFPKLPAADLGTLRENFVAVSSMRTWMATWLQGPLSEALTRRVSDPETPVVLMIGRGRLTLRTACATADVDVLQSWLGVFETAIRQALRVAADKAALPVESGPETGPEPEPDSDLETATTADPLQGPGRNV